MKKIGDFLPSVMTGTDSWKMQLLRAWPTVLGDLTPLVSLEKIDEPVLVLGVQDSCWLQELYMLSPLIIKMINKNLDQPRIKALRFKTRGTKNVTPEKKKVERPLKPIVPLTSRELAALEKIGDAQLKEALQGFLNRCQQEKE
jgi:hypothetical protein